MCKYKRQSMFIEFCQKSQKEVFFGKLIKTSQKDTEKKDWKKKKKEGKKKKKRCSKENENERKENWLAWCLISFTSRTFEKPRKMAFISRRMQLHPNDRLAMHSLVYTHHLFATSFNAQLKPILTDFFVNTFYYIPFSIRFAAIVADDRP